MLFQTDFKTKKCTHLSWGGIPIVILVGDDYQLPSIYFGAIYSVKEANISLPKNSIDSNLILQERGFKQFKDIGSTVMQLNG